MKDDQACIIMGNAAITTCYYVQYVNEIINKSMRYFSTLWCDINYLRQYKEAWVVLRNLMTTWNATARYKT